MTCFLKRVLPFALTLIVGLMLGTFFGKGSLTFSVDAPKYEITGIGEGSGSGWRERREVDYNGVFNPRDVDRKAQILQRVEPRYTQEARADLVEGTVVLRAVFSSDGLVKNIRAVSELPDGLTERAVEAARLIKFSPALKDGRAVSQYVQIEYNFNLY
jgi:TonB family protein